LARRANVSVIKASYLLHERPALEDAREHEPVAPARHEGAKIVFYVRRSTSSPAAPAPSSSRSGDSAMRAELVVLLAKLQ
jgi:hypothetical protein